MRKDLLNFGLWLGLTALTPAALAHDKHPHHTETATETAAETPADKPGCDCAHAGWKAEEAPDHEHMHHGEDTDYSRAFKEGTPTLFSPSTVGADDFTLFYSHNFYWSSLPHGSNPAFWFKYSPLDRLQLDFIATLRTPLELEGGVSYQILDETRGDWLSLTPRLSFNSRGTVFGGEVAASKFIFPEIWQVGLNAQVISSGAADSFARPVAAVGLNTIVRVWKHWHLFGDVVLPLDSEIIQKRSVLWSAGIKKRIPHTPHILTLYVGNEQEQTLSGRTISPVDLATISSAADLLHVGFVFSINIDGVSHMGERLF